MIEYIYNIKIKLVYEMGAFLVEGSKGDKYAVTLFKREMPVSSYWYLFSFV